MARFYYISDLHYDHNQHIMSFLDVPADASSSNLIIAGDLYTKGRMPDIVTTLSESFKNVIVVAGNHDYYGTSIDHALVILRKSVDHLKNVVFLEQECAIIDGIKIAGCTLWHRLDPISAIDWRYFMNDSRLIKGPGFKRLHWEDIQQEHIKSLKFIENSNADILVTHHALSNQSVGAQYQGLVTNQFYTTHTPGLLSLFKHHVHGHMHQCFEYEEEGCFVHCNPYGYDLKTSVSQNGCHYAHENNDFSFKYFDVGK